MDLEDHVDSSLKLRRLQVMAAATVPDGVAVACAGADGDVSQLFAIERTSVERAVLKRQKEFAAGRTVARSALQLLGHPAGPIPVGPGRSPVWPAGFVGSISHSRTVAIAVAARISRQTGFIGIDVEETQPLERDLWDSVCNSNEIAWFESRPDAGLWATTIFSIKEAVYKAQYPATARLLDFQDVEVRIQQDGVSFAATVLVGDLNSVSGSFRKNDDFILAFAAAQPTQAPTR